MTALPSHSPVYSQEEPFLGKPSEEEFCGESSQSIADFNSDSNNKSFVCEICQKRFAMKTYLKRHCLIHSERKPVTCEVYQKEFATESYLKKHLVIHTEEKPFSCELCQKRFSMKNYLTRHLSTHTRENASCVEYV